ncbi:hypothetical protein H6G00_12400 [Leptolyngbya sp. FACHB-541]|uniref:hypothetical protein n=1 Tax=Leptolyngbya sp. FACHB-541 TaxID=2692810 RepID=UPI00168716B4|nr:hypothetical protein [Leptolyngbya sp. FACHB-541]MBD1997416.1 hypothetical protein [Leptolyngbya sp. FACHB-541]
MMLRAGKSQIQEVHTTCLAHSRFKREQQMLVRSAPLEVLDAASDDKRNFNYRLAIANLITILVIRFSCVPLVIGYNCHSCPMRLSKTY